MALALQFASQRQCQWFHLQPSHRAKRLECCGQGQGVEERLVEQTEGALPVEIVKVVLGVVGQQAPLTRNVTVARTFQHVLRFMEQLW